ncbi:MAG: hypothetical protein DRO16_05575 [Thermoprotei archaeon]|nr:MAG: hypothetical protein DRO16_05575 [Thermoprotei archaeon]
MNLTIVYRVTSKKSYGLLLIISMLFFILIFTTIGFVEAIYYLPEQIVYPQKPITQYYLVISSYSISPFTSIYNTKYITDKTSKIKGIVREVPEVLSFIEINGQATILRGVQKKDLGIVLGNYEIMGKEFDDHSIGYVWVGEELAEKMDININDTLFVYSPLARSNYLVVVKGIIKTNSVSKYELITNLLTARTIRGTCPECVSITLLFLRDEEELVEAYKVFNLTPHKQGLFEKALLVLRISGRRISWEQYEALSSIYLSRIGLSRSMFYALLITLTIILSLGYSVLAESIILLNKDNYVILYEQGLGIKKLKLIITMYNALIILSSFLLALLFYERVSSLFQISFLSYELNPYIDQPVYLASFIVLSLINILSTWFARVIDENTL